MLLSASYHKGKQYILFRGGDKNGVQDIEVKGGKDKELMQSSITPDPGNHMGNI